MQDIPMQSKGIPNLIGEKVIGLDNVISLLSIFQGRRNGHCGL